MSDGFTGGCIGLTGCCNGAGGGGGGVAGFSEAGRIEGGGDGAETDAVFVVAIVGVGLGASCCVGGGEGAALGKLWVAGFGAPSLDALGFFRTDLGSDGITNPPAIGDGFTAVSPRACAL